MELLRFISLPGADTATATDAGTDDPVALLARGGRDVPVVGILTIGFRGLPVFGGRVLGWVAEEEG